MYRNTGTINGNAFSINGCKNCDLYIEDRVNQVTVDNCENTNIVLGPSTSSIFLRTSKNCKFVLFA